MFVSGCRIGSASRPGANPALHFGHDPNVFSSTFKHSRHPLQKISLQHFAVITASETCLERCDGSTERAAFLSSMITTCRKGMCLERGCVWLSMTACRPKWNSCRAVPSCLSQVEFLGQESNVFSDECHTPTESHSKYDT